MVTLSDLAHKANHFTLVQTNPRKIFIILRGQLVSQTAAKEQQIHKYTTQEKQV